MTQATVFVSYSRTQFYAAEFLARILDQRGISAWLDVQELLPGADWQASIDQGLAACQAFILVASRAAYRSAAVQYEVAAARAAGKPIFLAVIEDDPFVKELGAIATVVDCRLGFSSSVTAIAQALQTGKPIQDLYRRYVTEELQGSKRKQARYQRGTPLGWLLPFGRIKYLQLIILNLCYLLGTGAILLRKQVIIHGPLNPRLLPYLVLATIPIVLWGLSVVYSLLQLIAFRRQGRVTYLALELWPALNVFAFPALFGILFFSLVTQDSVTSTSTQFGPYFTTYLTIADRVGSDPTLTWQIVLMFVVYGLYIIFVSLTLRGWLLACGWLLLIPILQSPLVPSLARPLALLIAGACIAFLAMRGFLSGHDVPIAFGEEVLEYRVPENLRTPWKLVTRNTVLRINEDRAWARWLTPGAFPNEAFMRIYQHAREPLQAPGAVKTWHLHYVAADAGSARDIQRMFAEYPALRETTTEHADEQIAILSNKTPRHWIDALAARYPRLICIIISSLEVSALDEALQQHQWIDYRQQRPYQIHNLARSLAGMASTINPTTPENFTRPVGPYPAGLVVHALRMGGTASVVLGVAAQLIAMSERIAMVSLPLIVASIALGVWAWWVAARLLARNAFLPEVALTFSAMVAILSYWVISGAVITLLPREVWVRNGAYNGALTTGLAIVASFIVVPFLFFLLVAGFELVRRGRTLYRWLPHYTWPTWQRTLAVAPWRRLNLSSFLYLIVACVLIAMVVVDSPYHSHRIHEYDLPDAHSFAVPLVTGADGMFQIVSFPGTRDVYVGIDSISPTGDVQEQRINIPQSHECKANEFRCFNMKGVRFGPDHQLWYVVEQLFPPYTPEIRRSTLTGATTRFLLPTHSPNDYITTSTAFDSEGNLWYTREVDSLRPGHPGWIGRLDPTAPDGSIKEFELPLSGSPTSIVAGPDGNMWFFEDSMHHAIGKITPEGVITEYPLPYESDLAGVGGKELIVGHDHNLWFADSHFGAVGRITTSGVMSLFASESSFPTNLIARPDGGVWFLDRGKFGVGGVTPGDQREFYPLHALMSHGSSLTADADGSLWVTLYNQVGHMTPEGALTLYDVPTLDADLGSIIVGPDHHVWFVELTGLIGELSP